jgi:hypothetical protein
MGRVESTTALEAKMETYRHLTGLQFNVIFEINKRTVTCGPTFLAEKLFLQKPYVYWHQRETTDVICKEVMFFFIIFIIRMYCTCNLKNNSF